MRISRSRATGWAALFAVVSSSALADEPKVEVLADVILASNEGTAVDPPSLVAMKTEFASAGLAFSSYQRLSSERLSLTKQKPSELKLPNGKVATVKLEDIKNGTAQVKVNAGNTEVGLKLGREGQVFVQAGAFRSGQLVLMLSPGSARKP